MANPKNIMLCVEQAGDAANLRTLGRCKKLDPKFERTILIRTKLDKWYQDLSPSNINEWFSGFGDLPENMSKFAVSLPFWSDDTPADKIPDFLSTRDKCVRTGKFSAVQASHLVLGRANVATCKSDPDPEYPSS